MRTHTVDIYVPLHSRSRSYFANVHTLLCPLAQLALGQVHLCRTMGGSNNCNMVLTLAVLLMSRQVCVEVHLWRFFFLNCRARNIPFFFRKTSESELRLSRFSQENYNRSVKCTEWRLQRQQIQPKHSAPDKLASGPKQNVLKHIHLQRSSYIFYMCLLYHSRCTAATDFVS